jgi:hypothetical protein
MPDPTPAPSVESLTPEQAGAEGRRLTAELLADSSAWHRPVLEAKRLEAFKRAYGTGEAGAPYVAPPSAFDPVSSPSAAPSTAATDMTDETAAALFGEKLPVIPWEVQEQLVARSDDGEAVAPRWDHGALAETEQALTGLFGGAVPATFRDEVRMWVRIGLDQVAAGMRFDPEKVDELIAARSGNRSDEWAASAEPLFARLTPARRASVVRFLDHTGLSDTPAFIEWAAGWNEKIRGKGAS